MYSMQRLEKALKEQIEKVVSKYRSSHKELLMHTKFEGFGERIDNIGW